MKRGTFTRFRGQPLANLGTAALHDGGCVPHPLSPAPNKNLKVNVYQSPTSLKYSLEMGLVDRASMQAGIHCVSRVLS